MPHNIEEIGIAKLIEYLQKTGHRVKRLRGTFDLEVDGQLAEVKTKTKCFAEMDFISLTQNQWEAAKGRNFDVYVVCGVDSGTPEFYKVHSQALLSTQPRVITSCGVFDFDAVSEDRSIVATISTSGSKTSGGKYAVGKILKLRSDMLFLTMVEAKRRVIVLTEQDMCDRCEKEFQGGRVPTEIEFVCAVIPGELRERLIAGRLKASGESLGKAGTP